MPGGLVGQVRGQGCAVLQVGEVVDAYQRDDGLTVLADNYGTVAAPGLGDEIVQMSLSGTQRISHARTVTPRSDIRGHRASASGDCGQMAPVRPAANLGRQARQDGTVRVVVISDTHAPRRWKSCPAAVALRLRGADLILHAGDVCTAGVLDELSAYAPVRAVLGNNDGPDVAAWGAPPVSELDLGGLPVAMVHDSGSKTGRMPRLRKQFPEARLIVFGHSHIPWNESDGDVTAFNPGSPTDRRSQPQGTIGVLQIEDGRLLAAQIVPVT
jgi:putative phosphoesterase